jgi:ABC-2 type transport system permease protein
MSTIATDRGTRIGAAHLSAAHLLRAEWVKYRSLRSSYWAAGITVLLSALFASILILGIAVAPVEATTDADEVITGTFGERPTLGVLGYGFLFATTLVGVLAVLLVSTERGTGLFNVTFTAVPRRTPVLAAKLVLSAGIGFALGLTIGVVSYLIVSPELAAQGYPAGLFEGDVLQVLLGGAVFLSLIAVLSTSLGSMFRGTASGAGTVLALLVFAPVLLPLIPAGIGAALARFLPTSAGMMLYQPAGDVGWATILAGSAILLTWVAAAAVAAVVLLKRRDV